MNYLHARFNAERGATVDVTLSRRGANVMLMTDEQYDHYSRGDAFDYYGENFQTVRARVEIPSSGNWNLVVDMGGAPGSVTASYAVVPQGRRAR
jgi:D-alanyl-D-alanine dipeptidase